MLQVSATSLKRMAEFYNVCPYPNRFFLLLPDPRRMPLAHMGFARLCADKPQHAEKIWQRFRRVRAIHPHALSSVLETPVFSNALDNPIFETDGQNLTMALVGCGTDEPVLLRALHPKAVLHHFDLSVRSLKIAQWKLRFWHIHHILSLKSLVLIFLSPLKTLRSDVSPSLDVFIPGDAYENLTQNPQGHKPYDHIQCFGVLHHQHNPHDFFQALIQALAPKGTLRMMVYSTQGRRLERRVQKKWGLAWSTSPYKILRILSLMGLKYQLFFWHIWQQVFFKVVKRQSVRLRFRYLGFSKNCVADAFLHPSDWPLSLRSLDQQICKNNIQMVFCEAKIYGQGWVGGCGPHAAQKVWQDILKAEDVGDLESNITFILKK